MLKTEFLIFPPQTYSSSSFPPSLWRQLKLFDDNSNTDLQAKNLETLLDAFLSPKAQG